MVKKGCISELEKLAKLWGSFKGRDQTLRFVQYGTRFLRGVLEKTTRDDAAIRILNQSLHVNFMNSRRAFRVVGSLTPLMGVINGPTDPLCLSSSTLSSLHRASCLCQCLWHWIDHIRYLTVIRWLDPALGVRCKRLSFSFHTLGRILMVVYFYLLLSTVKKQRKRKERARGDGSERGKEDGKWELEKEYFVTVHLVKSVMDVFTFAHVSELLVTSDIVCGGLGALSSIIDLRFMYRSLKL